MSMARGMLQAVALLALGGCGAGPSPVTAGCEALRQPPVLLVHGSGLGPQSFAALEATLVTQGWPSSHVLAVRLEPADGANLVAARDQLAPAADGLLRAAAEAARRAGCPAPDRLDIVAHSMGAFSSRYYAAWLAPGQVRRWVAIAGANHGTDALCGYSGTGNREMCPAFARTASQSAAQAQLNGTAAEPLDPTPYGVGADQPGVPRIEPTATRRIVYYTIRLAEDPWIQPARSAELDGAGGLRLVPWPVGVRETTPGNLLWEAAVDHDAMPAEPGIVALVLQLLRAPIA